MNSQEYLAFCRNELKRSKKWRSSKSNQYDDQWRRYIDLYQGKHYDSKSMTDQLTVNMVFATMNVMGPAVAINNPRFVVNARKSESAPQAIITEEVLNYLWLLIGHGWLKVGYKAVKPPEEKTAPDVLEPSVDMEGVQEGVDDREDVDGNVESELIVDDDRPFLERISPFDMYVDPDARHPKEMRWIAQRTWRAVADVHVDERYSATNRKRVSGSSWSRWDADDRDARGSDEKPDKGAVSYVEVIEFYDIKRKKVTTFANSNDGDNTQTGGFLIKPKPMPYAMGQPFVMFRNYEIPDHFYPLGDVCQIESLQLELNETRNQMLNYRKKYRRGWTYDKERFDREGIAALESDQDNVMVPVTGGGDPSTALPPIPATITPPEFFDQSALISNDIDRVSGVSDYQRGAQTSIKRTATEAAMIQDAANARAQDRLAKIEGILSEVAERIIGLMQQYIVGEQMARIVTMPVRGWVAYDADRIRGQFDYEVQGGSTEPQNETFRRQSAMQLADVSSLFMQTGVVNVAALYQELLQKGFGIKDASRLIQQQPPPGGPPGGGPPGGPPGGPQQQAGPPPPQQMTPEMFGQMAGGGQQMQPPPQDELTPEMMAAMMGGQGQGPPQDIPPELLAMLQSGGMPPQ